MDAELGGGHARGQDAERICPHDGARLTESALAWVITSKYQDGLPLYRQAALLGRFGGELSRNTLAGSLVRVGVAAQPIINLLRDQLLDAALIHGDEAELQVLKEPGRAAQRKSYLWAHARRRFVEAEAALPKATCLEDYEALLPWRIAVASR